MKPTKFKEANVNLQPPADMPDCGTLWAHRDGTRHVSRWALTPIERVQVLFTGVVWVWVHSGFTQPPICPSLENPFRKKLSPWERLQMWWTKRNLARIAKQAVRQHVREREQWTSCGECIDWTPCGDGELGKCSYMESPDYCGITQSHNQCSQGFPKTGKATACEGCKLKTHHGIEYCDQCSANGERKDVAK